MYPVALKMFTYIALALILGYLAVLGGMYVFQRGLLYHPARELETPRHYGFHDMQEIRLQTKDGVFLTVWYQPPATPEWPVIVYFHGNTGNLADRTEKYEAFLAQGMGVLALSYRGFGTSTGSPSEEGLYEDARTVLRYAESLGIPREQLVLFGESLGSGVAVQMAIEQKVKAIVLEAPYTSISARAQEIYWYIPVELLLKDKFRSLAKIKQVQAPVLIFHGYRDEVMPIAHGRKLLAAANEPKEAHFYAEIGHTDFDPHELAGRVMEFVKGLP